LASDYARRVLKISRVAIVVQPLINPATLDDREAKTKRQNRETDVLIFARSVRYIALTPTTKAGRRPSISELRPSRASG
jgi:hypothetical protein